MSKVQEVILRALSGRQSWLQVADVLGVSCGIGSWGGWCLISGFMLSTLFRARVLQMLMTDREESTEAATGQTGQVCLRMRSSRA